MASSIAFHNISVYNPRLTLCDCTLKRVWIPQHVICYMSDDSLHPNQFLALSPSLSIPTQLLNPARGTSPCTCQPTITIHV